jgi:NAD(P)H-hydrate epimerase
MARLAGCSVRDVLADREGVARATAASARATVVLKGVGSIVAAPSGELYMNPTGNSGLASGGTGDVLTGIIAAFLGQGVEATRAAALGVYVHGLAGDLAAEALGEAGMIAGDVLDHVPYALMELGEANR